MSKEEETPLYYHETWEFFLRSNRELSKARIMEGYFTVPAVTRPSTPQLLMEPQHQRPPESISQDSREELLEQVISKHSEPDSVSHDVSNIENVNPQIIVSAIPVEMVGKIDLDRCKPPSHVLVPYLNKLIKLVSDPKGPNCKIESSLSARSLEQLTRFGCMGGRKVQSRQAIRKEFPMHRWRKQHSQ